MLARIGTVHNLIEYVIHPLIDGSFRNQASSSEAMRFMLDRHEEQNKVEAHVRSELEKYHVECVSVLICQIKLPDSLMETLTSKVVASQQMSMYDSQQKQQQLTLAEAKGQSTKLEQDGVAAGIAAVGKAEAEKIRAIGNATAGAYKQQVEALGGHSLAMIELMKRNPQAS